MLQMPRLGQGTWRMGERASRRPQEVKAIRAGIEAGMTLIDTAEMYAQGEAESIVGEAIAGYDRDTLFLVSKVYPHNAAGDGLAMHCEASLRRLGVEALDLYLLHWRGSIPLQETVEGMQRLVREGKIRHWGVSNFDLDDMISLFATDGGSACAANQVLYHLASRGIEYDLKPWLDARQMPTMAYCPLAQGGALRKGLLEHPSVLTVAQKQGLTPQQVLLGFVMAQPMTVAIPKASALAHVKQNAAMLERRLDGEDLATLGAAFPAPSHKAPLDIE